MLDAKLKPWMIEVNHTPSFNADTGTDEQVKADLLKDTFEIIQMSVEHRKAKEWEIRTEKKQQEIQGMYKRMSAKEHCDRVKFDPSQVKSKCPNNGFRLIYPKDAPGDDPDLYIKIMRRAHQMWKLATGTVT
jgi:tubulin polyglutamylase TTLL6/13